METFRIQVPESVLEDLQTRLSSARLATPPILEGGETPEVLDRIDGLLAYWRDGYDWRAAERRLNEFPQFRAKVGQVGLHFLHVRGSGPDPLPLLLTNGWPSSFVEYLGVLEPLVTAGFSVVVPALPGLGFSDHCLDKSLSRSEIADLFDGLMVDVLGYRACCKMIERSTLVGTGHRSGRDHNPSGAKRSPRREKSRRVGVDREPQIHFATGSTRVTWRTVTILEGRSSAVSASNTPRRCGLYRRRTGSHCPPRQTNSTTQNALIVPRTLYGRRRTVPTHMCKLLGLRRWRTRSMTRL